MIQLINVQKSYAQGIKSLSDVTLTVKKGEFVFVTGATGSGKTTLLKLLYCEERPTSGKILINGKNIDSIKESDIPYVRRRIGVIFQDFKLLEGKTVLENLAIPLEVLGLSSGEILKRAQGVLNTVRLNGRLEERVSSLSAGEQQKVAIARSIINNPSIIIADEPTGSLDSASANKIMDILRVVNSRGITIVCATHNLSLIKDERVIVMDKGRISG